MKQNRFGKVSKDGPLQKRTFRKILLRQIVLMKFCKLAQRQILPLVVLVVLLLGRSIVIILVRYVLRTFPRNTFARGILVMVVYLSLLLVCWIGRGAIRIVALKLLFLPRIWIRSKSLLTRHLHNRWINGKFVPRMIGREIVGSCCDCKRRRHGCNTVPMNIRERKHK